jgi:outer membrane autotransporter protein
MMKRIKSMASRATSRRTRDMTSRVRGLRAALLTGTALAGMALAQPVAGQTTEWQGTVDTDWFTAANWDTGSVPTPTNRVTILNSNPGGAGVVVSIAGAQSRELFLRDGGLLTISGAGTLQSVGDSFDIQLGGTSGPGTVIVTGADARWTVGVPGGTVFERTSLQLGWVSGSTGILRVLSGGAVHIARNTRVGQSTNSIGNLEVINSTFTSDNQVSVGSGTGSTGTVLISGGSVTANTIRLAVGSTSNGTLNIGAASGDPAAAAGALNTNSVEFENGTATLVFNHTATASDNYALTADLVSTGAGTHAINHHGGVTTYHTGDGSGFAGTTTVSGGELHVNSSLGGAIAVNGGMLGGTGTLGALTVNGGVLAPGNSIGTLNVASATFNPGSIFQVELNDGGFVPGVNNDLLNATGAVTINGGTIHVTPVNGTDDGTTYTPGTYTIITAVGGVSGTFDAITDDFAFLSFTSAYDANNAYLVSSLVSPGFCLSGFTANQCAAGAGVSSLGAGNALFDAVLGLSNADAPIALNQLSGEAHASGKTALINNSSRLRSIIGNRIDGVFSNQRPTAAFMSFASKGSPADQLVADRYGAWGHAFGSWGNTSSTANTAAMRHDDAGFMLGADSRFGEAWYGGVFTGYSRSNFKVSGRGSSGSSDNYHLGLYGGGEFGAFHLSMGAAHTWHRIGTTRQITLPVRERLTASYNARTMQIFGEASYRLEAGAARFEPFAGLAHVNLRTDGFTEAGGAAALRSFGGSTATTFSTLGLRASTQFQMGDMTATARGMIGWRHAFGDTTPTSRFAFAGGNSFVTSGAPIARNAAVMEFGLDMQVGDRATLGLSYDGQLAGRSNVHGAKARLRVSF